MMNMTEPEIT